MEDKDTEACEIDELVDASEVDDTEEAEDSDVELAD